MDNFRYEIVEHLAVLGEANDRVREVNMVSWCGNAPKLDIRWWSKDHTNIGKGVALSDAEAKALLEVLKERYE